MTSGATLKDAHRLLLSEGVPLATADAFVEHFISHPGIWSAFERLTLKAIARDKRIGAKCIMENVRYFTEVEQDDEFKVNNNFTAYYARVFAMKHPNFKDYFETRTVRGLQTA